MATVEAIRRRGRWSFLVGTVFASALIVTLIGASAFGASLSSASFSGTTGTVSVGGTLYAKSGGALTLTVNTANNTRCVDVTGAHTARQTSATAKPQWTFAFTAGAGNGAQTVNIRIGEGSNANGCTTQVATGSASYVLDNTGPTVTGALSPAPNAAGWNKDNVAVAWSAADAGAGLQSGPTPASDSQTANTAGVTKSASATDGLGNTGTGSVTVKLDKMAPSINAARNPAPNAAGWNNTDVTVSFTCSDGLSGIKSCTGGGSVTLSGEGANQSVPGTAVDNADNVNNAGVTGINIDKTAPTVSGAPTTSPNGNGWYSGDVTVAWTASDALSGLAGAAPANSTITGEGPNLGATSAAVSDKAGNSTSGSLGGIKIDRTAPVTSASAPPAWNNVDLSIELTGDDGLSGVAATYYKIGSGAEQTYSSSSKPSFHAEGVYTLEYWSVDNAGNQEQHHSIQVRIDKTPPTIQANASPAPNANGWNNGNVTVSFTCNDALSGVASCSPDETVSGEGGNQQVSGNAVDNAGNSATAYASVSLDKTPPTISAAADRAPNGAGWYDADVHVSFACADALSGIDVCPATQTLGEGGNQSASGTAFDNAGNNASAGVSDIDVDKTAPSLSGAATANPNANGWYNADVTIAWTASDALSGLADAPPANSTIGGEGSNLSASASVSDKAGNSNAATVAGIKIDRTAPVTQIALPPPAADDWYGDAVEVTLDRSDTLSGVAATHYSIDGGPAQSYSGPFSFDENGVHTIRFWSVDNAGNTEDAAIPGHEATIKVDKVNPSISGTAAPSPNASGWNNSAVIVSFSCSDAHSGIRVSPPGCPEAVALATEGAGQSASGTAFDRVNNSASATVSGINVDLTAPVVSGAATTAPNGNGWYNGDVTVAWTASDALSGLAGSNPPNSVISGEGSNLGALSESVSDKAGNTAAGSITGIKIDRTAPTVTFASPADNSTVVGDSVEVKLNASDLLSGVDEVTVNGEAATALNGVYSRIVALACGQNTIPASGKDKAGNPSAVVSRKVTRVCYSASYMHPLDMSSASASVQNTVKYGRVVPVKVQVLNVAGSAQSDTQISAPTVQVSRLASCTASTSDAIEESFDAGSSNNNGMSFRWDPVSGHWIYNLDTKAMNLSTTYCYRIDVKLDGNVISSTRWALLRTLK